MAVTLNASTTAGLIQTADTTGNLSLQSNGTTIAALTSTGLAVTGAGSFSTTLGVTGVSSFGAGAIGAPSIYLSTDTTTGLYRIGANNVGFAVSGAKLLDLSSSGLTVRVASNNSLVVDSANVAVNGTLGVTGLITASVNGKYLLANGATTGQLIADIQNTGGRLVFGIANSAGTAPISSSTAYSVILNSDNGTPIELAVSSVTQLKVISTGVTIPGTTKSASATIADDAVTSFTVPSAGGIIVITNTSAAGDTLIAGYSSSNTILLSASSNGRVSTGVLNGTTGVDTTFTFSMNGTTAYIENRRSYSAVWSWYFIGG